MKKNNRILLLGVSIAVIFFVSMIPQAMSRGDLEPRARWVDILTPSDGEEVSGTVAISIDASRTPKLYIDGSYIGRTANYNWDTTGVADGTHHSSNCSWCC